MTEPIFLSVADVEFLHGRSIARYGGTLGTRDRAGLESAVNHPKNVFYYGRGDLFVTINVVLPTNLSAHEKKLLKELAKLRKEEIEPQERGVFDKVKTLLE